MIPPTPNWRYIRDTAVCVCVCDVCVTCVCVCVGVWCVCVCVGAVDVLTRGCSECYCCYLMLCIFRKHPHTHTHTHAHTHTHTLSMFFFSHITPHCMLWWRTVSETLAGFWVLLVSGTSNWSTNTTQWNDYKWSPALCCTVNRFQSMLCDAGKTSGLTGSTPCPLSAALSKVYPCDSKDDLLQTHAVCFLCASLHMFTVSHNVAMPQTKECTTLTHTLTLTHTHTHTYTHTHSTMHCGPLSWLPRQVDSRPKMTQISLCLLDLLSSSPCPSALGGVWQKHPLTFLSFFARPCQTEQVTVGA